MKNIILIAFFALIVSCTATNKNDEVKEAKLLLRCLMFPAGVNSSTYLIEVFDDRKFKIFYGEKNTANWNEGFTRVIKHENIVLDSLTFYKLLDYQKELKQIDSFDKTEIKKGGWEIKLETIDKHFNFYYGENDNNSIGAIINELILISPIKIDLHSWS